MVEEKRENEDERMLREKQEAVSPCRPCLGLWGLSPEILKAMAYYLYPNTGKV